MIGSVASISFAPSEVSLAPNSKQPTGRAEVAPRIVPEFFFGPENALLAVAVEPLVRSGKCAFRPLLLVGPSGVGKSHLAAGIALASGKAATLLSAADFARQATEAASPVELAARLRALHGTETLILEDVHQLAKKTAAQHALAALFDALIARGATVIATSDCPPSKLSNFAPALADRLSAGLVVMLSPPSPVVRRAMIAHIADREKIKLSPGAADRLAEAPLASWNELRGALLELRFAGGRDRAAIRSADVRQYMAELPARGVPEVRDIAIVVAKHFGVRLGDLLSPSRRRGVVAARAATAYLARKCTSQSLQQIGRCLGGRDHTTILHSIRELDRQLEQDAARRQVMNDLLEAIQPTSHKASQSSLWKNCRTHVDTLSSSSDT